MSKPFFVTESASVLHSNLPSVELVHYKAGYTKEQTLFLTHILVVTKGSLFLSYDQFLHREISPGMIVLLPTGCHFTLRTETPVSVFIFRQKEAMRFCGQNNICVSNIETPLKNSGLNCLKIKKEVNTFLSFLKESMDAGLQSEEYLNLKNQELLYLLRGYYTKEQLSGFFYPLLSPDVQFHEFVLRHYRKVKTVKEFADKYKCSVSNFDKKFRVAFGVSPHQWMKQQKVNLLYHEINTTDKPLSQIAREQQFLSLPQFNDYCKKHFGYPPGKMRRMAVMFRADRMKKMKIIE